MNRRSFKGKNNPNYGNFKENASYSAIHFWVDREKKKTGICSLCGKERKTMWMSKTHKYNRDLDEFIEACRSCHEKYDNKIGFRKQRIELDEEKLVELRNEGKSYRQLALIFECSTNTIRRRLRNGE